jgi:hypothetical protein
MSLDSRLRAAREARGLEMPFDPPSANLPTVYRRARQLQIRRRAAQALAGLGVLIVLGLGASSLLQQLGIQKVNTADDPPTETELKRDDGLGTSGSSERGGVAPPKGQAGQTGQTAGAPRGGAISRQGDPEQKGSAAVSKVPAPMPAGAYFYDVSGYFCGVQAGCGPLKERKDIYDPPSGSHQRSTSRWTTSGGRFDAEYGYDFRADGVYWEHFNYTVTDNNGVVMDTFACPELAVMPQLVWRAGAKPGDHFEDTRPCNPYVFESGDSRTITDILRAETVSIGGRDVSTLFVRVEWRRGSNYNLTEGWVFPDNYLFVKERLSWSTQHNYGEYHTMLKSLNPS